MAANLGSQVSPLSNSINGIVKPGLPTELIGQEATEKNDLRRVMLEKPEILPGLGVHFTENCGMLTEIMAYMGKSFDPIAYSLMNQDEQYKNNNKKLHQNYEQLAKNFTFIGNNEFAWRVQNPKGYVYKVTETVTATNGIVGKGGALFKMTINKPLLSQFDVLQAGDQNTQIVVMNKPTFSGGKATARFRVLFTRGTKKENSGVFAALCRRGAEWECIGNIQPEFSRHGSKIRVEFGNWAREFMTTQRFEWNTSGLAAHTKLNPEQVKWLTFINSNGKVESYWTAIQHYEMMRQSWLAMDNACFWGKPFLDENGEFYRDVEGRTFYSGTGIYHQASRRLKREYNNLTSFKYLDNMIRDMYLDTPVGKPTILIIPGAYFRQQLDELFRNVYSVNPMPLYFDGFFNNNTNPSGKQGLMQGIRTNFMYYEMSFGRFVIANTNYFDRKNRAQIKDNMGISTNSQRALFLNITANFGGQDNIMMLGMAGRQGVIGKVAGMGAPGAGGLISTTDDVVGEHILNCAGAALMNPNCIGELRKAGTGLIAY